MLATEPTPNDAKAATSGSLLETWAANERMRHIPPLVWMIEKLEGDIRRRLDLLSEPLEMLFADNELRIRADGELRAVCTALDRLADVARHSRSVGHPPAEVARHAVWSLNHAIASMRSLDADLIGRRFPFQTFERSKAEPLYAAFLNVIYRLSRLVEAVRAVDSDIDGRLLDNLVRLESPLPEEPLAKP